MKIRGHRECKDCGRRWSYYETASVACPGCGSLRSVGVDERTRHTDGATNLDLSEHRTAVSAGRIRDEVSGLKSTLRAYLRQRGFIAEGELLALDDTFVAAHELLHAIDVYDRLADPTDDEQYYVLNLLRGADAGERPTSADVPSSMSAARGLAYANAVRDYRRDVVTWLDDHPDPEARRTLGALVDHVKRSRALGGDVPLSTSDSLVNAARELSVYLVEADEDSLVSARNRLSRLD
jgi:hypothetical protein